MVKPRTPQEVLEAGRRLGWDDAKVVRTVARLNLQLSGELEGERERIRDLVKLKSERATIYDEQGDMISAMEAESFANTLILNFPHLFPEHGWARGRSEIEGGAK